MDAYLVTHEQNGSNGELYKIHSFNGHRSDVPLGQTGWKQEQSEKVRDRIWNDYAIPWMNTKNEDFVLCTKWATEANSGQLTKIEMQ